MKVREKMSQNNPTMNHLIDYFPNYISTDSIFAKMSSIGAPWEETVGQQMDILYFTMYSGIKNPSILVTSNYAESVINSSLIANLLYTYYGHNWERLWDSFNTEYTPIDGYNIKETIARTESDDRSIDTTNDYTSSVDGTEKVTTTDSTSGNDTTQHGLKVTENGTVSSGTYGFNTSQSVPVSTQTENRDVTNSGNDVVISTSSSSGGADTATNSARADKTVENKVDSLSTKEDTEIIRSGITGSHTYQELLKQEFELWKFNFFEEVFKDVDKLLTLSVYSNCMI